MIYKNYILGKKLSGLDIYLVFFCLLLVSLLGVFFYVNIITSLFFCKLWRLVNANCNFCVFNFCIYFNLVGINQKYMLLTYLKKKIARCPILNSYFTLKKAATRGFL